MNGKLALSGLVAAVFMFLTDWLWFGMLMKPDTPMPGMRPEPLMLFLVLGMLIFGLAFAYFYSKGVGSGTPMNEGLRFGLWVSLLVWVPLGFMWYSLADYMTLQDTIIEMVFRVVQLVLMGILVAYLSGGGGMRGKGVDGGDG